MRIRPKVQRFGVRAQAPSTSARGHRRALELSTAGRRVRQAGELAEVGEVGEVGEARGGADVRRHGQRRRGGGHTAAEAAPLVRDARDAGVGVVTRGRENIVVTLRGRSRGSLAVSACSETESRRYRVGASPSTGGRALTTVENGGHFLCVRRVRCSTRRSSEACDTSGTYHGGAHIDVLRRIRRSIGILHGGAWSAARDFGRSLSPTARCPYDKDGRKKAFPEHAARISCFL